MFKIVNNAILNCLKISKAGILRTLYPIFLDFFNVYKSEPKVNENLVKKWKFICYPTQGYKLLVLVLTIKTEKEKSTLKPVTLKPFLLPFEKIESLNTKILYSLFLFGGKIPETKRKDFKFNGFMFLKNVFAAGFSQKHKAGNFFKKSLVFNGANKKRKRQL